MKLSREDLIESEATMNQMRNAIYHLQRFMKLNGITEIREKMRRMGRNIARSYVNYWIPIEFIDLNNVNNAIATIYRKILDSSVSVDVNESNQTILVKDNDCALCKYKFDDIEIAGCEIIAGLVSEMINLINEKRVNQNKLKLEPMDITQSFTFGDKSCLQIYKYKFGGK